MIASNRSAISQIRLYFRCYSDIFQQQLTMILNVWWYDFAALGCPRTCSRVVVVTCLHANWNVGLEVCLHYLKPRNIYITNLVCISRVVPSFLQRQICLLLVCTRLVLPRDRRLVARLSSTLIPSNKYWSGIMFCRCSSYLRSQSYILCLLGSVRWSSGERQETASSGDTRFWALWSSPFLAALHKEMLYCRAN